MNNKGQSLVTFVIIFPILFLMFLLVYNIGSMVLLKSELDDINYIALDYGIDNINNDNCIDNVKKLIVKNKDNIDNVNINIEDGKMYIILEDSIDTKASFGKVFNVKSSYVGYIKDDKKIIEKISR